MVEILAKVFVGLFGSAGLLFIVFVLFTPGYSFVDELFEKDEDKKKSEEEKLTKQVVIFGSIVTILGLITLVLAFAFK